MAERPNMEATEGVEADPLARTIAYAFLASPEHSAVEEHLRQALIAHFGSDEAAAAVVEQVLDENDRKKTKEGENTMGDKKHDRRMVFALTEREDRTFWTKVGVAYANRDGSITCKLDALPVSGTLQIRDEESRNERNQERERDR